MSFENVVRGKLSLKGKALPSLGVKKKKKVKKPPAGIELMQKQALEDAQAALKEEEARGGAAGVHETTGEDAADRGDEEEEDYRTPAEKRYHEQLAKLEAERAAKQASKSHRQKVEEFNQYLANLSEHHDIPKVGPG